MKAVILKEKGSFDNIVVEEISKPIIAADEILVKVKVTPFRFSFDKIVNAGIVFCYCCQFIKDLS